MGKKRKYEDMDEEKLARKIRKLQDKLRGKQNKNRSPSPDTVDDAHLMQNDEDEFLYHPPSDWAGTVTPIPGSPISKSPEPQSAASSSPQPGPSTVPDAPTELTAPKATTEISTEISTENAPPLEEAILTLLGDAPKPETVYGKAIHKDIAARWQEILAKGLSKETKEKLISEYLIPANCQLLEAPLLNPEAKAALSEALVKRDFFLQLKQKQIAAALAALAQVTEMLVTNDFSREKLLKPVSDASRLLCDSHCLETKSRRSFVVASINSNLKGALTDANRDKYLFGENLTDKLNSAKTIQKSGDTLKNQFRLNKNFTNREKINRQIVARSNSKALHPRGRFDAGQVRSTVAGRAAPANRPQQPPPPPPPRRARSPPPPPPPRTHYNRR